MCQPFWRERRDLPRPVRWMNGRDSDGSMAGVDGQGRFPGSVTCSIRRGCSPKLLQKSWLFLVFFDYVFFWGGGFCGVFRLFDFFGWSLFLFALAAVGEEEEATSQPVLRRSGRGGCNGQRFSGSQGNGNCARLRLINLLGALILVLLRTRAQRPS
jgi:hypothetical protein